MPTTNKKIPLAIHHFAESPTTFSTIRRDDGSPMGALVGRRTWWAVAISQYFCLLNGQPHMQFGGCKYVAVIKLIRENTLARLTAAGVQAWSPPSHVAGQSRHTDQVCFSHASVQLSAFQRA